MLFLPLFLLSLLPLLSSRSYCLDSKCPFKCCQDFYSCALTPDCSSPDSKPYTYPFPIGSSCQASSDCISDCCYAGSTCEQMSKCSALVGGVVGSIAGVFALVVVGFFMIRAMRKKRLQNKIFYVFLFCFLFVFRISFIVFSLDMTICIILRRVRMNR